MPQTKSDRGNNSASASASASPMPKPKHPTTYSPLCKTKNVAAHFGRCKTTLGSKPAYLAPFPLPFLHPPLVSHEGMKRSTSRHIAAYVNASWAAFHVHVPNESFTFGRDRRAGCGVGHGISRSRGGGWLPAWQVGRLANLAARTRSSSRQTPK